MKKIMAATTISQLRTEAGAGCMARRTMREATRPVISINVANDRAALRWPSALVNRFAYERITPRRHLDIPTMTAPALGHGLSFDDLYDRDGPRPPRCGFRGWLKDANVDAHARLMAARAAPDKLAAKDESNLLIELARPLEDFIGALFGVAERGGGAARARTSRWRRSTTASGCSCSATSRARSRPMRRWRSTARRSRRRSTCRSRSRTASKPGSSPSRSPCATLLGAEFKVETPTPEIEALTRYAAWALHQSRGQEAPSRRAAVQGAAQARLRASRADRDRGRRRRHAPEAAAAAAAPSRGLRADRRGLRPGARARSRQLLHLVPQPGQGQLLARPARTARPAPFQKSPFGVTLAGCPLEEKISEMNLLQERGLLDRRAGDGRGRQPDGGGDRPPHLQRLHEGLHLPEAGAGQHPADRDPHPEGRARRCRGASRSTRC